MTLAFFMPRRREFFEHKTVQGFGLGIYTALVIVLLREAFEESGAGPAFFWAIIGLVISLLIGVFVKEFHHHHSEAERVHNHNRASIWRILLSDFFHNIVDGIVIISGFGISTTIGITSFIGILGHQMLQQSGQQILLVEGGIKPKKALLISFFISLSILLAFLLEGNEKVESILVALSAGIIIWKVGNDVLHMKWTKKVALGFLFGILLLGGLLIIVPHQH